MQKTEYEKFIHICQKKQKHTYDLCPARFLVLSSLLFLPAPSKNKKKNDELQKVKLGKLIGKMTAVKSCTHLIERLLRFLPLLLPKVNNIRGFNPSRSAEPHSTRKNKSDSETTQIGYLKHYKNTNKGTWKMDPAPASKTSFKFNYSINWYKRRPFLIWEFEVHYPCQKLSREIQGPIST